MYLNSFTALWMVPLTQSKADCCRRSKWKGNRPFDFLFAQTCSTTGDNGFISPLSALWSSVPLNMSLCTHMLIQFSFEYAHAVSLNWLSVSQRLKNSHFIHTHTHTLLQNCRDLVLVEQLIYLKAPISYSETYPLCKCRNLPNFLCFTFHPWINGVSWWHSECPCVVWQAEWSVRQRSWSAVVASTCLFCLINSRHVWPLLACYSRAPLSTPRQQLLGLPTGRPLWWWG